MCTYKFLPPHTSFHILLSSQILLSSCSSSSCYSGGCRRRGAGLVLDHGAAASSGPTRGGPCEGGRPRGRPGLSRAPARTPQSPMRRSLEVGGGASGRPRMSGTGCLGGLCRLGGRRFMDVVIHCGCQCVLGGPRYSVCRCRVSTDQGVGCRHRGCLPIVPRWLLLCRKNVQSSEPWCLPCTRDL